MLVGNGIGFEHILQFTLQLLRARSSRTLSLATAFRESSFTAERPPSSGCSCLLVNFFMKMLWLFIVEHHKITVTTQNSILAEQHFLK
jgi:hypothetical protein